MEKSASFQFELESQPLMAMLTFELASPQIDAPPEIYVNGADLGPCSRSSCPIWPIPPIAALSLSLLDDMKFQYTGWMRAQNIVPGSVLKAGTNDVIMMAGSRNFRARRSAETQIQLKYLWDKSDYLLEPLK